MKIRQGFVSNSSSSSFTCCITGRTESGMDLDLEDAGFLTASDGNIISESEVMSFLKLKGLEEEYDRFTSGGDGYDKEDDGDEDEDFYFDRWESLPKKFCPLHNLHLITDKTLLEYLLKRNGETEETASAEIKSKFSNLDALKEFIKG